MNSKKLEIKVMIEGDRIFQDEFNNNQKAHVVVNKTLAHFKIKGDDRELKREDGTPIDALDSTLESLGIKNGEVLRFFPNVKTPDRDKGFA